MDRTCRVGVHGRNDVDFHEADYQIIREANLETLKMMSHTRPDHFRRLKEVRSDIELITRLYDDRFGKHGHPSPEEFATRMVPVMKQLQPYSTKFEVHNEPNHLDRIEGWGETDDDARSFNAWFLRVYDILKSQCPWAQLGFPGLAIPHRDLEWVDICRPAVEKSDWLGVHCYWQTPPGQLHNHLADFWGLRFKYYHEKFPHKIIDLTEVGNSNVQNGIPFTEATHAREFTEYLTECFKYPYLNSAAFFILSSPDPTWQGFTWRDEGGRQHEVVRAVRDMARPHWVPARKPALPAPTQPAPAVAVAAAQPARQPTPAPSAEVTRLQQQQSQLQSQLQQVQAQNGQLQNRVQQLQAQNNQLQSQIQQLQRQLAAASQPAAPASRAPQEAPPIQDLTRQLPRHPTNQLAKRPVSQIDRVVVHHTAIPANLGAARIAEFLVNQRGLPGIHYHYFITPDGTIQQTNGVTEITLQSEAPVNPVAVGVGFAGDFTNAPPPPAQLEAGARLIAWLLEKLDLPPQAVFGHKELVNTQSPGVQWEQGAQWGKQLRQKIQARLSG